MKYIHDGKHLAIWSAFSRPSHEEMARMLGIKPIHAGFIQFGKASGDICVFGNSTSLDLKSKNFKLPDELWIAVHEEIQVIGTNRKVLETMIGPVVPAKWILSTDDQSFFGQVLYPGAEAKPLRTNHVNGR